MPLKGKGSLMQRAVIITATGLCASAFAQWTPLSGNAYLTDSTKGVSIGRKIAPSSVNTKLQVTGGNFVQDASFAWRDAYKIARTGTVKAGMGLDSLGGALQFFTGDTALKNSSARMTILSGGAVGIGNTNPGYKLDISGGDIAIETTGKLIFPSGGASVTNLSETWGIKYAGNTTHPFQIVSGGLLVGYTASGGTYAAGSAAFSGPVGIGLSGPSYVLHVNGDMIASPAGSSTTTPRKIGSLGIASGQAIRLSLGDSLNGIQNANNNRMQLQSFWGMEIYGHRYVYTPIGFAAGNHSLDPSLNVYGTTTGTPVLVVTGANGQTGNLQEWRSSSGTALVVVNSSGSVGIGTTNLSSAKLAVNGTIRSKEVIVTVSGWSDFVFDKTYKLKPLDQVEHYVKTNSHLENIPSESEVKAGGIAIGDMQAKLLRKLEEVTLYLIEQNKKIELLTHENSELHNKLDKLASH
jgi:hypothetical protein